MKRMTQSLPITKDWRDIEGAEGLYMVSRPGQVMSLERTQVRTLPDGTKRRIGVRRKLLKPYADKAGYFHVCLQINGKSQYRLVHRLVAHAFVEGYEPGKEVNHIDGNKANNHADNLEWVTHQDNISHYYDVIKGHHIETMPTI